MRAELGLYGSQHMHTPNLDALANESLVFDRAYIAISLCMPSRTAFLTSSSTLSCSCLSSRRAGRPASTKNFVIHPSEYWRNTGGPNATTLPVC